jgi:hypothetical protein
MRRLTRAEIKPFRDELATKQGLRCAICSAPLTLVSHLDHDHTTGVVRGVLHPGCNLLLGKVENNARRTRVDLLAFALGLHQYLQATQGVLHPNHLTPEEKLTKAKRKQARRRRKIT